MTLWTNIATPVTAVENRLSTFFDLKTAKAGLMVPWFEQLRALYDLIAQHQKILPQALSQVIMEVATDLEGRTV